MGNLLEATLVKKDKSEVSVQLSTNPVFSNGQHSYCAASLGTALLSGVGVRVMTGSDISAIDAFQPAAVRFDEAFGTRYNKSENEAVEKFG